MTSIDEVHSSRRMTKVFSISSEHLNEIRNLVSLENRQVSSGISTENEGSRANLVSVNTNHELSGKFYYLVFINKKLYFQDDLPDDWTTYNFERKRSCILSNIYSTCVTKAINHLESLQLSIDKWYLDYFFICLIDFFSKRLSAYENKSISTSSQESEYSKVLINFTTKRKSIIKSNLYY